uniref:DNA-binding protein n=1 Tax=Candidatus Kentrum sp. MB TaxID=2138164 RepID=A0A450XY42_9GAMM|nr:MAG: DNA-binding protein [Candidatus Kentron sp. MB]VFK34147.1 MAG: DNA-binding protein [Candidatus Kentron sp. MB]VFK76590.1 MAG: DNA-binding protein [Candidatus Kentron sp. MB]
MPNTESTLQELPAIRKPLTKPQLIAALAEGAGLTNKAVASVLDELTNLISQHVRGDGAREFTLPGILKIRTVFKPATEERTGILALTGKETVFKAKPARMEVKISPLGGLKGMAQKGMDEENGEPKTTEA